MKAEATTCIRKNEKPGLSRLGLSQSRGADMGLTHLSDDNPPEDKNQARPRFAWPALRQTIGLDFRESPA